MTISRRLCTVRVALQAWAARSADAPQPQIRESMLIRDGFYCGRKFIADAFHAVWFIEEDVLKIFAAEGRLVHTATADAIDTLAAGPTGDAQPQDRSPAEVVRWETPPPQADQTPVRRAA